MLKPSKARPWRLVMSGRRRRIPIPVKTGKAGRRNSCPASFRKGPPPFPGLTTLCPAGRPGGERLVCKTWFYLVLADRLVIASASDRRRCAGAGSGSQRLVR
jgi:hypothetical protein